MHTSPMFETFIEALEDLSTFDNRPSLEYQAGFLQSVLAAVAHVPEVQQELQIHIQAWMRKQGNTVK